MSAYKHGNYKDDAPKFLLPGTQYKLYVFYHLTFSEAINPKTFELMKNNF